jgi:hypothetical protein
MLNAQIARIALDHRREHLNQLTVFVGVREPVQIRKRMRVWVRLFVIRLSLLDDMEPVTDTSQGTAGLGAGRRTDVGLVLAPVCIDRELMGVEKLRLTCTDERGHDVVKCRTKVMDVVAGDHGEAWFFDLVDRCEHLAPAAIWIDFGDSEGQRIVLPDDGKLFIERSEVVNRSVELGVRWGEVEAEQHR